MSVNKNRRRDDAEQRQVEYTKLTIQQRIDKLDKFLGKGIGAKRERARLNKLLVKGK